MNSKQMNSKKSPNPNRSRRRTADHAQLAADIAKVQALREAGLSPIDALTTFRAGLGIDEALTHARSRRSGR